MGNCLAINDENATKNIKIHLSVYTWSKQTFGLFSFKADELNIQKKSYFITESRSIFLNSLKNKVYICKLDPEFEKSISYKLIGLNFYNLTQTRNSLEYESLGDQQSDRLWELWNRTGRSENDKIEEGNVFRFGRQMIRFLKIPFQITPKTSQFKIIDEFETIFTRKDNDGPKNEKKFETNLTSTENYYTNSVYCRICLETESEANPFEKDLCNCSKHMPAHLKCIIKWMGKKCIRSKSEKCFEVDYKLIFCDICKQKYPLTVKVGNKTTSIIEVELSEDIQSLLIQVFEDETAKLSKIFILRLQKKRDSKISIGRSETCDIVFPDISVSRNHASLIWKNEKLFLDDLNSKFGSLKLVEQDFDLEKANSKKFVIDKFMLEIHLVDKGGICSCKKNVAVLKTNPNEMKDLQAEIDSDKTAILEKENNIKTNIKTSAENQQTNSFSLQVSSFKENQVSQNNENSNPVLSENAREQVVLSYSSNSKSDEQERQNSDQVFFEQPVNVKENTQINSSLSGNIHLEDFKRAEEFSKETTPTLLQQNNKVFIKNKVAEKYKEDGLRPEEETQSHQKSMSHENKF